MTLAARDLRRLAGDTPAAAHPSLRTTVTSKDRPVTIFIAEDNPVLLQGLDRALSAHGYAVETAANGMAIMERLSNATARPDLLLLDVMMPGMSGLEVVEAVQKDPRLSDVPVMLITAATGEQASAPLADGGQVEVLVKPFRLYDLLSRIEANVSRSREEASLSATIPGSMA